MQRRYLEKKRDPSSVFKKSPGQQKGIKKILIIKIIKECILYVQYNTYFTTVFNKIKKSVGSLFTDMPF